MTEETAGPTWLKIGGLLSGIAALLTALVTAVATFVDIWPDRSVDPDEGTAPIGIQSPKTEPSLGPPPGPTPPGAKPTAPGVLSPTTAAVSLVRYEADGCYYPVTILEADNSMYRVRFPFKIAALVAAGDVRPARAEPSALQLGDTVFVPGARANSQPPRYPSYKLAIIDDILRSTVHVKFEPDDPCPVSHELLALPASEVLVATR